MFEMIKGTGSGELTALMETRRSLSGPYNRQTDHEMKAAARYGENGWDDEPMDRGAVDLQCLIEIAP